MNRQAKGFLVLAILTVPAGLWLGGDWWKWVITAVALAFIAVLMDMTPEDFRKKPQPPPRPPMPGPRR